MSERDDLLKALEPFADIDGEGDEDMPDDTPVTLRFGRTFVPSAFTLGDLRRARSVLSRLDREIADGVDWRAQHDKVAAAGRQNIRAAWAALRMIREAVEQYVPVPSGEHLAGPEPHHEADALIEAINKIATPPAAEADTVQAPKEMGLTSYEIAVLRMMNGGPELPWGAAISAALEHLQSVGYCTPGSHYKITDKGRAALAAHEGRKP